MRKIDDLEEISIRPRRWPIVLGLLALLGGLGFVIWRATTAPEPLRVLVAIDVDGHWFEGSEAAARLADALNAHLASLGFSPVHPGDPEVLKQLEDATDPQDAARSLRAAFLVSGTLAVEVIEHPVEGGYFEVHSSGTVTLQHIDDTQPAAQINVVGWSGGKKRDQAIALVADGTVPTQVAAGLIPALLNHGSLAELLKGDVKTVGKLIPAQRYVKYSAEQMDEMQTKYDALGVHRAAQEKGAAKVSYHSDFSTEDLFCATSPKGVLVKTENALPFVSPQDNKLHYMDLLETIEWRKSDGKSTVLWSGYNTPSYPAASQNGEVVAFCEDLFGWAKTITVINAEGTAERLAVDGKRRYSSFHLSPTGIHLVLFERACRKCANELSVWDVKVKKRIYHVDQGYAGYNSITWLDDQRLVVLYTPGKDEKSGETPFKSERQGVFLVDFKSEAPTPTLIHTVEAGHTLKWAEAIPGQNKVLFAAHLPDGDGIGVLDVPTKTLIVHPVAGRVRAPRPSPDGKWATFNLIPNERGGDEEIAVVKLSDGIVTRLTNNPFRDRYPRFSHDGRQVYFESLDHDPSFPRRNIMVVASVPAP